MNPQNLLDQFLGSGTTDNVTNAIQGGSSKLANSGLAGVAGGVAAGGLLGLLLGNKKARKQVGKVAGGVVGYGGAAALGALAYRAYQNWQDGQKAPAPQAPSPAPAEPLAPLPADSRFRPEAAPARDGKPFELALVMAMIAAANADGHIDQDEQRFIFDRVGQMPLESDDKAFVFDLLGQPPSLQDIAGLAEGPEQAAELYLVSRLAIDPDQPIEQAYLEGLSSRLGLEKDLVSHLDAQAMTVGS